MTFCAQTFKENAVKIGVEVFIIVVNDSNSKENADTCTYKGSNESWVILPLN